MKIVQIIPAFLTATMIMIGCSTESNNEAENGNNASGIIRLSGEDTSAVGTELEVGDIDYGRVDLTGLEDSIIIVHKGVTISEESIVDAFDSENGFVIVAGEQVISMTIVTDGVQRQYACDSTFGTFTDCNDISINEDSNEAVFTNTTVQNVETGSILTMNGTLRW